MGDTGKDPQDGSENPPLLREIGHGVRMMLRDIRASGMTVYAESGDMRACVRSLIMGIVIDDCGDVPGWLAEDQVETEVTMTIHDIASGEAPPTWPEAGSEPADVAFASNVEGAYDLIVRARACGLGFRADHGPERSARLLGEAFAPSGATIEKSAVRAAGARLTEAFSRPSGDPRAAESAIAEKIAEGAGQTSGMFEDLSRGVRTWLLGLIAVILLVMACLIVWIYMTSGNVIHAIGGFAFCVLSGIFGAEVLRRSTTE